MLKEYKHDLCMVWLKNYLGDRTIDRKEIIRDATAAGFSTGTIKRAAELAKVVSVPLAGHSRGWRLWNGG